MFDFTGFTPRAQKIITILAQKEARRLFSDELTPEHILLGMLQDPENAAIRTLIILGVDLEDVKREIESFLKDKGGDSLTLGVIPISSRVQDIVELAKQEAKALGHNYIGTEHLLLGMMNENNPGTIIPFILENRGITLIQMRQTVIKVVGYGEVQSWSKKKKEVKTPHLDKFCTNITLMAAKGELDVVVGRKKEIQRVIQILERRQKNNPILIGEPGVGKTAIVEGISQMIVNEIVPEKLLNKKILLLDMGSLVAGTKYRGEFEERMKNLIKEAENAKDVIIFIDEIHTLLGTGNAEGALDASNLLKPALARGKIRTIGATTFDEYKKRIEKDKALVRRFQSIIIEEPSLEDTVQILMRIKNAYEEFHHVTYTKRAIKSAVELSNRYLTNRFLPDKAIDIIDEAGAKVNSFLHEKPFELITLEKEIELIEKEKNDYVEAQDFESAAFYRDALKDKQTLYDEKKEKWLSSMKQEKVLIDQHDISEIISDMTDIPVSQLDENTQFDKYIHLDEILHKRIKGQKEAVNLIASSVKKSIVGLRDFKKPIASFIFLGPTGVGKTELAKALAQFMFGTEDALLRFDMSEYMERHNTSRLLGAPPGYVGYEAGGELTERIKRRPYSVLLFDEMEKANPEVFNTFLQILDDGFVTDSLGTKIDFKNTIIIFTSNLGSELFSKKSSLGFLEEDKKKSQRNEKVLKILKDQFKAEFLNRIDETIIFDQLDKEIIREICDKMILDMNEQIKVQGMKFIVAPKVKDYLIEKGFNAVYGARALRRTISKLLEVPASELILEENMIIDPELENLEIKVTMKKDKPSFKLHKSKLHKAPELIEDEFDDSKEDINKTSKIDES